MPLPDINFDAGGIGADSEGIGADALDPSLDNEFQGDPNEEGGDPLGDEGETDGSDPGEGAASEDDATEGREEVDPEDAGEEEAADFTNQRSLFDANGRIPAEADLDEYHTLTKQYQNAGAWVQLFQDWENGELSPAECQKYGLPTDPESVKPVAKTAIEAKVRGYIDKQSQIRDKIQAFDPGIERAVRAVRGVAEYERIVGEVLNHSRIPVSKLAEASGYIFTRAAQVGGAKWLANRQQAAKDVAAHLAGTGQRGGKAGAGAAKGAAGGGTNGNGAGGQQRRPQGKPAAGQQQRQASPTNTPKNRVIPVGTGKSAGSAQQTRAAGPQVTMVEKQVFQKIGKNPANYTPQQRQRIVGEYNRLSKKGA